MKTTLELPDELLREVKQLTREQGVTMRELVTEGLRSELARRRQASARVDFRFPFVGGEGVQAGVDPHRLVAYAYDEPS